MYINACEILHMHICVVTITQIKIQNVAFTSKAPWRPFPDSPATRPASNNYSDYRLVFTID